MYVCHIRMSKLPETHVYVDLTYVRTRLVVGCMNSAVMYSEYVRYTYVSLL